MPIVLIGGLVALPTGPSANANAAQRIECDLFQSEVISIDVGGGGYAGRVLTRIESIYVDNTRGASSVVFKFSDTSRLIIVPAGAEGCYDTFSRDTSFLVFQSSLTSGVRVRMMLFACRRQEFERFPGAAGILESKYDVNNAPGGYVAGNPYVPPAPVFPGNWDAALFIPGVSQNGNHLSIVSPGSPTFQRFTSIRNSGIRMFEILCSVSNEGGYTGAGVVNDGLTTRVSVLPPNTIAQKLMAGGIYSGSQAGTAYALGDGIDANGKIVAVGINFAQKRMNMWINGAIAHVIQGDGNGMDITTMLANGPLRPGIVVDNSGTADYTINTTGNFVYASSYPTGYSPWDVA